MVFCELRHLLAQVERELHREGEGAEAIIRLYVAVDRCVKTQLAASDVREFCALAVRSMSSLYDGVPEKSQKLPVLNSLPMIILTSSVAVYNLSSSADSGKKRTP